MKVNKVFDYKIQSLTYEQVIIQINNLLKKKQFNYFITLNPEIILLSEKILKLKTIIQKAYFIFADGIGVQLASKILTKRNIKKITGSDLTIKLLNKNFYTFYFIGSKNNIIQTAVKNCQKQFPKSVILGYHHGYFKDIELDKIISDIKSKKPDIILVGLGSPKQEYFLKNLQAKLNYGIGIGIGGVFDILSGDKKRAPIIFQKLGLEWFFRALIEPSRLKRWIFIPKYFNLILKTRKLNKKI